MSDHPRSATLHETSERGLRVWPLWAKIVVPVTGVLILGGITSACEDDTTATDVVVAATESDPSQTVVTIEPSSTVPSTTPDAAITTQAPTATAAPTTTAAPVTAPPTPAPTAPPQTVAFVAPPPAPAPATDPRFDTCKDAKANGFGPYSRGVDPEYNWYRDADSDGIVCE